MPAHEIGSSYQNTAYSYSIDLPPDLMTRIVSHTGAKIGFINYDYTKMPYPPEGYHISIDATISANCAPEITGIFPDKEEILPNVGEKTIWGPANATLLSWKYGIVPEESACFIEGKGGYGLCSQKNGKAILICISEMTDNPELALKIFKTFKWTKE